MLGNNRLGTITLGVGEVIHGFTLTASIFFHFDLHGGSELSKLLWPMPSSNIFSLAKNDNEQRRVGTWSSQLVAICKFTCQKDFATYSN